MSSITTVGPRTLGDVIPGGLVRNMALVVGGTLFVACSTLVAIPLPFTPVPLTLQTFAVLLVGSALGSTRGLISVALYALVGMAGVPWFSQHQSGFGFPTFGYVVGFVLAAWLVGKLAERGSDRHVVKTVGLMVAGNVVIYAFGIAGLMLATGMPVLTAIDKGLIPFLLGDALKIALAAGLLPGAWKLLNSRNDA